MKFVTLGRQFASETPVSLYPDGMTYVSIVTVLLHPFSEYSDLGA